MKKIILGLVSSFLLTSTAIATPDGFIAGRDGKFASSNILMAPNAPQYNGLTVDSILKILQKNVVNGIAGLDSNGNYTGSLLNNNRTDGVDIGTNISKAITTIKSGTASRNLADKLGDTLNVQDFNAVCDGSTDDTAAFNAAFAAAADTSGTGSHHIIMGNRSCKIAGTLTLPIGVWFQGSGSSGAKLIFGPQAKIIVGGGTAEGPWKGAQISDLYIDASSQTSSSPFVIDAATNQPVSTHIDHVNIEGGVYYGIDMSGNNVTVDNVMIQNIKGIGIRVGYGSTKGNNTDPKITNSTLSGDYFAGNTGTSSAILTEILDAGGLTLQNDDMVGGKIGTLINPQANQNVFHVFASNTVLSDSAQQYGLEVDTGASTAAAFDMKFEGSWTANAQSMDVAINNNGGGTVGSFMFIGHRFYLANGDAFHAGSGVNYVTISDSQFCGNNMNGTAVFISENDVGFIVTNNRMPASCEGEGTGNSSTGVSGAGDNDHTVIVGNDMNGIPYPINFTVSDASKITAEIAHNIGPDKQISYIGAKTTTTLPQQIADYAEFNVSDGTTVTNLAGGWIGRHVFLHNKTIGPVAFGTSGNVCNTYNLAKDAFIEAVYTSRACWYLH